jgi:hypothetical protein
MIHPNTTANQQKVGHRPGVTLRNKSIGLNDNKHDPSSQITNRGTKQLDVLEILPLESAPIYLHTTRTREHATEAAPHNREGKIMRELSWE